MFFNPGCNCVTSVFLRNTAHFTFKPMNLKRLKTEVYKSVHFLKASSVRILKRLVLPSICRVGQLWPRVLNSTCTKGGDVTFLIMFLYIFNHIFASTKDVTLILVSF